MPTFTMSKFLASRLQDGRKITSTGLSVDTSVYYDRNVDRNGVCLLYAPHKSHRLPELVLELARRLAEKYPHKTIYLYGDDKLKQSDIKNIHVVGSLTLEQTAELYNKTELGVIFSTTNPSRVGFEMVACGCPCIEADNEFLKHDMDSDAFINLEPTADVILKKVDSLFSNSDKYRHIKDECAKFAKENFYEYREEKHFLQFLERVVFKMRGSTNDGDGTLVKLDSEWVKEDTENRQQYLRLPSGDKLYRNRKSIM